jgi:hypothetical protein
MKGAVQLKLKLGRAKRRNGWGGRREGAGRPRKDGLRGPGEAHLKRCVLKKRFPVHVNWRMGRDVWNLRAPRCASGLARAMWSGGDRFGFRLVHYAILRDHVHLIVEAEDRLALSKGMKGLGVRIARFMNGIMKRSGRVIRDRYHEHILKTPTEVRNARHYLLRNAEKHYGLGGTDELAPVRAVVAPRTFMLRLQQ